MPGVYQGNRARVPVKLEGMVKNIRYPFTFLLHLLIRYPGSSWCRLFLNQIAFYHSLLGIINPDPLDFFNAILAGKMGIVVKSAKESGNDGCGVFVQLETGAEFIDRYPSLR